MCRKIRCDGKSWNLFGFWVELNKALVLFFYFKYVSYEFLDVQTGFLLLWKIENQL